MNVDTTDEARLAALDSYGTLDTPPEQGFDSIVELATQICACPVALVSLIDRDRQWFKARVGFAACETDLNSSVCAHALTAPDLLVIPDLTLDPRTAANPLVTGEPAIRFYAGAPLRTADGHALGSLCVIDRQPRPGGLTAVQAASLKALAAQVMTQLELGRAVREQQRLLERGEAVLRTQTAITAAAGDLGIILQTLIDGAMEVIPHAEGGVIEMREGDDLVYSATAGSLARDRGFRTPLRGSLAGSCLASGKAMLCRDVVADGQMEQGMAERLGLRSCLLVPIHLGGEPVGVMKFHSARADAFSRQDLQLASVFSGTVKSGLAEAALRLQARSLKRILELGDRLRDADTVAAAAAIGSEMAGRALRLDRAGYGAVDPQAGTVTMGEHWGVPSIAGIYTFDSYGAFIEDLRHDRPVIINDVAHDPRTAIRAAAFRDLGIGALINIPIFERGRFVSIFYAHKTAPHVWTTEEIGQLGNIGDRTRAAVARLQAEAQQAVLNEELAHRMKNTMAMVQAIAIQTLRDVTEKDAVAAFTDRVHALSTAHGLLMQSSWAAAEIAKVVAAALENFRQLEKFDIDGPELQLGPRSVLSLSMLLHELTTNAVKYGALSVAQGRIALTWRVEPGPQGDELVLDWVERGGPAARTPARKGFGSRLIGMGLVGSGGVKLTYGALGFEAEMRALIAHVQQS